MQDSFDIDECTCDCHHIPDMMHVMACCVICPNCDRRIRVHAYDSHKKVCKTEDSGLWRLAKIMAAALSDEAAQEVLSK